MLACLAFSTMKLAYLHTSVLSFFSYLATIKTFLLVLAVSGCINIQATTDAVQYLHPPQWNMLCFYLILSWCNIAPLVF